MALRKCKDCGGDVSKKAETCPHCGAPLRKKKGGSQVAGCLVLIIIGVVLAVIFSTGDDKPRAQQAAGRGRPSGGPPGPASRVQAGARRPAGAPRAGRRPPPPGYVEDLAYAWAYAQAAQQQRRIPVLTGHKGSIGIIEGTCQVFQVLLDGRVLLDRLGQNGLPVTGKSFILRGLSTSDLTSGQRIGLSHIVVMCLGTETYVTVLGATRTVWTLQTLDPEPLVAAAQYRVTSLETDIQALEATRIGRVAEAKRQLAIYLPSAETNENAAKKVEELRARLIELDAVSGSDLDAHNETVGGLKQQAVDAKATLQSLRFP